MANIAVIHQQLVLAIVDEFKLAPAPVFHAFVNTRNINNLLVRAQKCHAGQIGRGKAGQVAAFSQRLVEPAQAWAAQPEGRLRPGLINQELIAVAIIR